MKPYLCWWRTGHEKCADFNRKKFVDGLVIRAEMRIKEYQR